MALFLACELPNLHCEMLCDCKKHNQSLQISNQNFLEAAMAKQVQVFGGTI